MRRRFERVYENLESGRVPRQLEQTHDANDAEDLQYIVLLLEARQQEVEIERQRRDEVDDVDRCAQKLELVRRDDEANDDLEREPRVTGALDVEEGGVRFGAFLLQRPYGGVVDITHRHGDVDDDGHAHVGVRLETERQDRDDDEEDGHDGADLKYTPIKYQNTDEWMDEWYTNLPGSTACTCICTYYVKQRDMSIL